MRVMARDSIRFAVRGEGGASFELEVRLQPDRFGGWEARALLHEPDAGAPLALGRVFRAKDRRLALGKMVAWVRRRYLDAEPLAERRAAAPLGARRDAAGP
jgi:hypothetical protein